MPQIPGHPRSPNSTTTGMLNLSWNSSHTSGLAQWHTPRMAFHVCVFFFFGEVAGIDQQPCYNCCSTKYRSYVHQPSEYLGVNLVDVTKYSNVTMHQFLQRMFWWFNRTSQQYLAAPQAVSNGPPQFVRDLTHFRMIPGSGQHWNDVPWNASLHPVEGMAMGGPLKISVTHNGAFAQQPSLLRLRLASVHGHFTFRLRLKLGFLQN